MSVRFTLNGKSVEANADPNTTLLTWLRDRGLTGTKEGCAEGECGACAVVLVRRRPDADSRSTFESVNSCLLLLAGLHGQEVVTVEGVGKPDALHPVQAAMVELGGSQCGYCTPGFVMSMFAEFYRDGRAKTGFDPESIAGNLCRCTGYRPIREAGRSLGMVSASDPFARRNEAPPPHMEPLDHAFGSRRFLRPTALSEALSMLRDYPEARIVCGGTDLVVEMNQHHRRFDTLLCIDRVAELATIEDEEGALRVGAAVPLSELERWLNQDTFPAPSLRALLPLFSSRLIRNRATLGGNIATASPIGDSPPVLLSLDASVEVATAHARREIPIDEFFLSYRKTALERGELIVAIRIPKPLPTITRFYKVSKRTHDDISTVAAGFSLQLDKTGLVTRARLAYGGVAATPVRLRDAESALEGQPWNEGALARALEATQGLVQPLTDQRASAEYRRQMVGRLLEKFYSDTGVGIEPGARQHGGHP